MGNDQKDRGHHRGPSSVEGDNHVGGVDPGSGHKDHPEDECRRDHGTDPGKGHGGGGEVEEDGGRVTHVAQDGPTGAFGPHIPCAFLRGRGFGSDLCISPDFGHAPYLLHGHVVDLHHDLSPCLSQTLTLGKGWVPYVAQLQYSHLQNQKVMAKEQASC